MRMSAPFSSRCVAKLWRRLWTVIRLLSPAARAASGVPGTPPGAQHDQQPRREHGIAILLAFALTHADQHAAGIDIANLQVHHFADSQAGPVSGHQRGAVANRTHVLKQFMDFGGTEDQRQFLRDAAARYRVVRPGGFQGHVIEKFDGGNKGVHSIRRQAAFIDQVQLIFPDLLQAEKIGAALVESGQAGDIMHVGSLRFGGQAAQLHVFDHALTQRCHARAP